jgi:NAD(P)-dependent dehydrogenase (short-subunit alcohol dehydrogenase family)
MPGRLEGKVAIVTGGASGIGAGIVRRFVEEGARCVVADIQDGPGQALVDELSGRTTFVRTDVSVEDEVAAVVAAAVDRFGRLDCMVNNAGILGAVGPIASTTTDAWLRSMDVLLHSVFYGIKHAASAMIPNGGGTIINTASTAGLRAGLGPHAYTTAKHGVVGLTQSTATELARHGIRVNAIAPGATISAMTAYVATGDAADLDGASKRVNTRSPLGRPGERHRPGGRRRRRGARRPEFAVLRDGSGDRARGRTQGLTHTGPGRLGTGHRATTARFPLRHW